MSTSLESVIGAVMGEVLVRNPLSPQEDFFNSGGDSLRAIEVLQALARREDLPPIVAESDVQAHLLEVIFDDATPAGLAAAVTSHV